MSNNILIHLELICISACTSFNSLCPSVQVCNRVPVISGLIWSSFVFSIYTWLNFPCSYMFSMRLYLSFFPSPLTYIILSVFQPTLVQALHVHTGVLMDSVCHSFPRYLTVTTLLHVMMALTSGSVVCIITPPEVCVLAKVQFFVINKCIMYMYRDRT